jgi:hypothetical protein
MNMGQLETAAERYLAFMRAYRAADEDVRKLFEAKVIDVEARRAQIAKALTAARGGHEHE